ncbi:MAG TPA: hypothetical protein VHL79_21980 [Ramlibacter sp.]|jgi:hypothetical protein|nr:hypothetical protein [Ramlibacter sp.]
MSGVILRCPNCGTTRATPGECDACHDAEVRYFCTNHEPGVWLDGSACTRCGARFGDPARAAPTAPAAPSSRAGAAPSRRRPVEEVFGRREEAPPPRAPRLEDLIAAARAREAARRAALPVEDPAEATRRVGGCLGRALMLLVVFVVMIFSSIFMFAGSMFRVW